MEKLEIRPILARTLHKAIRQFEAEGCPEAFDLKVHIDVMLYKLEKAGYLPVVPVNLEVLGDEELMIIDAQCTGTAEDLLEQVSRATIAHNEKQGQLYRIKR